MSSKSAALVQVTLMAGREASLPRMKARGWIGLAAIGVLVLALLIAFFGWIGGYARTGPNEAGVVYNGGPFDRRDVRQVIGPSSGLTWTGFWSADPRFYPSENSPRRYIITSQSNRGDRGGVDVVRVPTADGIDVGLEAKISFTTSFTGLRDDRLLRTFDARYGNRTYNSVDGSGR